MHLDPALKYPNSVTLFRFCKRILEHRSGGKRAIDQEVGHILDFDAADCSHWKKGRKNVHSIYAIRKMAQHLDVDETLISDLACGLITEEEAYHEYLGYGTLELAPFVWEDLRKQLFISQHSLPHSQYQGFVKVPPSVDRIKIKSCIETLLKTLKISEAPLYLPELAMHFPDLRLEASSELPAWKVYGVRIEQNFILRYPQVSEFRPLTRFLIAKAMCEYFLPQDTHPLPEMKTLQKYIFDIESTIFALYLLAPTSLLKKEIAFLNPRKDSLSALSEKFWVSKTFMNLRLKEWIQHQV